MSAHTAMRSLFTLAAVLLVAMVAPFHATTVASSQPRAAADLPPVSLDALDSYRWSTDEVIVAPGQRIVITNRDVDRHTFTVDAWQIDLNLPTLEPVELVIPEDADVGDSLPFYSSVGTDRERGLEGILIVVSPDEILAGAGTGLRPASTLEERQVIELDDTFAFSPSQLDALPGEIVEVRNEGLIEHHFVIDDWEINETIPAGDVVLVQIPVDAEIGMVVDFYCSVPGHQAQGMTGVLTVVAGGQTVETVPPDRTGRVSVSKDLRFFVPDAEFFGADWEQIRVGAADTLLDDDDTLSGNIFPSDGLGAIYVGPQGSRITLIVLPVTEATLPANQIAEAIADVQSGMIGAWNKDRIGTAATMDDAPPTGCDTAQRTSGIVPVLTLPAGATACQLRGPGVAIFVAVEGSVGDVSGVDAADAVVEMVVTGRAITSQAASQDD
jgi:plastocyanin